MNTYDATAVRLPARASATDSRHDVVQRQDSKNVEGRPAHDSAVEHHDDNSAILANNRAFRQNAATTSCIDTNTTDSSLVWRVSPASAGLHIHTPVNQFDNAVLPQTIVETPTSADSGHLFPLTPSNRPARQSSVRSVISNASIASTASPGSTLSSPFLAGMSDLTPLPSPLTSRAPADTWSAVQRPPSRTETTSESKSSEQPLTLSSTTSPHRCRKAYGSLLQDAVSGNAASRDENRQAVSGHGRNRSISDFKAEHLHNVQRRHVTLGPNDKANTERQDNQMHREAYLADQRGLTPSALGTKHQGATTAIPTTPTTDELSIEQAYLEDGTATEYLEIQCGISSKRRKFCQLRELGQGTFSKVMLATSENVPARPTPEIETRLDSTTLVAIKIVQHGPAGGADGERIETGLKREIEMLKTVSHPSIIHLKAYEHQAHRTLLVLAYCPGGDLFELASSRRELLKPPLIQRIFAELVSAVRYLHSNWIVHRDIKLENVLVSLTSDEFDTLPDPRKHPTPIITLTDLGLSRRIPEPPLPPLLETRCGSEDYAAPEILLGERYDGRQTDAWALGVLLYALLEGRLPFDPPPGQPERSRNTHRIARCDWIWCRFGDEDGDWDEGKHGALESAGARPCVEGLLKKVRMGRRSLEDVAGFSWVREGIQCPEGLEMRSENDDDGPQ